MFLHNTLQIVTITQTKNMSEVRVHAAFSVDNEETFLRDVQPMISATQVRKHTHPCQTYYYILLFIQGEKGCIHYALYKESGASKSYAMIETWASAGDLETHSKSDHVKTFQANQKGNVTAVIKTFVNV